MDKDKLTKKEKELLASQEGAFAVIMGYLKSERGKIAPSVFNKIAKKLNYPRQSKEDLIKLAEDISENRELYELYSKGFERIIKLDDVPSHNEETERLSEAELFSHVTNFLVDNEDTNANLREMRKLQREGVYMKILMRNLKKYLVEELKGMPRAKYIQTVVPERKKGDRSLVLLLSDWHVGALTFNEDTGGYNFDKLKKTVHSILKQTLEVVQELDIKHVYVFHLGDIIEHISMRNVNQAFDSEFPATKQIAKAQRLLVDMLSQLSKQVHVTFGIVAGNHDRFDGNKADKVYNDNASYIILDTLFMLQESFGQLTNVTLIDNREDTYEFIQEVSGKNIKVKHGDTEKKKDDVKIPKHIKNKPIDYYVMGHIHTTRIVQEDYSRFHVYVGSTMGANNYSKELSLPTTGASQMMMVLTEGSDTPMFIPLMINKGGEVN